MKKNPTCGGYFTPICNWFLGPILLEKLITKSQLQKNLQFFFEAIGPRRDAALLEGIFSKNDNWIGPFFPQVFKVMVNFKDFLFSPLPGEIIEVDKYCSNGLKPPSSFVQLVFKATSCWCYGLIWRRFGEFFWLTFYHEATSRVVEDFFGGWLFRKAWREMQGEKKGRSRRRRETNELWMLYLGSTSYPVAVANKVYRDSLLNMQESWR